MSGSVTTGPKSESPTFSDPAERPRLSRVASSTGTDAVSIAARLTATLPGSKSMTRAGSIPEPPITAKSSRSRASWPITAAPASDPSRRQTPAHHLHVAAAMIEAQRRQQAHGEHLRAVMAVRCIGRRLERGADIQKDRRPVGDRRGDRARDLA